MIFFLFFFCFFQVLKHLHKKLRNVSKKSEVSKKKVGLGVSSLC